MNRSNLSTLLLRFDTGNLFKPPHLWTSEHNLTLP